MRKILENDLLKTRRTYSTRKRNADQEITLDEHTTIGRSLENQDPSPSRRLIDHEKARLLNDAMRGLSEDHQLVIQLRNFDQLSFEEVGQRIQRSADASRKLWSRAIQALQTKLSGLEDELLTGVYMCPPKKSTEHE
ncbi:MAG: sigma-70 family RNA polymerase sigma factor [Pirellulaceae bacterium]